MDNSGYGVYLGPDSEENQVHHNNLMDNASGSFLDEGTDNKVFKNKEVTSNLP